MKSLLKVEGEYIIMSSVGKLIFGFFILAICFVGAVMIIAQEASTPFGNVTIGDTGTITCSTSMINQTAGLVSSTTSFGTGAGVVILFIIAAFIILAALALIAGRK